MKWLFKELVNATAVVSLNRRCCSAWPPWGLKAVSDSFIVFSTDIDQKTIAKMQPLPQLNFVPNADTVWILWSGLFRLRFSDKFSSLDTCLNLAASHLNVQMSFSGRKSGIFQRLDWEGWLSWGEQQKEPVSLYYSYSVSFISQIEKRLSGWVLHCQGYHNKCKNLFPLWMVRIVFNLVFKWCVSLSCLPCSRAHTVCSVFTACSQISS